MELETLYQQFDPDADENVLQDDEDVSNDEFLHQTIPFVVGFVSVNGHGVVDIGFVDRTITTRKVK